ncbi:MAG: MFS transporter [Streptosporangiaceae bacterium]|nr:MFS transporter [Streptosporangiaceae bacterium]
MASQTVVAERPAVPAGYRWRWLAAIVMIVGALMDMIDVTIVNVALPTIRRDLHATATQLEWVVSGYMLAFAAALIIAGNLGDLFGRKRIFLLGAGLFGLASLCAGLSASGADLIAARVVQGAAAAAMTPQVLATFRVIFAPRERGAAFGVYGAMLGFASAIGLVLGGVLTEANLFGWSWRSVFFVNVPVAACAMIAGLRVVPETRDQAAGRPDLPGAVLLAASLIAVVYPLLEGRALGWPAWVWPVLLAGLAGLGLLGVLEHRRSRRQGRARPAAPLLRAGLLRIPAFAAGLGIQVAFAAGMQGFFLAFALWLQAGEHFSPLKAGLTAVAFSAGSFIGAPAAVPLAQRHGRGILASGAAGMVAGILGVALAAGHVGVGGSPWPVVPGLVVAGAGLALLVVPLVNVVLAAVPAEVAGGASGLFGTAQQLGGALGVAVLGTVFFGYLGAHSFEASLVHTAPYAMGAFALCGALSMLLPRTAVSEEALTEA